MLTMEIAALHQSLRTTMVYVTHDQVEAMTLADRIVVLRDGPIEQAGTPLALYEHPASTFVDGFIGAPAMNLLDIQHDGLQAVLGDGARMALPIAPGQRPAVRLGVRPEHLEPAADGPFALQVQAVERLGATAYVHGRCAGLPMCAEVREPAGIVPGQTLQLGARHGRLHAFDESGLRLAAA